MDGPGGIYNKKKDRYDYDHSGSMVKPIGVRPVNNRDLKIKQFCFAMAHTWTSQTQIEHWLYQLMRDLGYDDLTEMEIKWHKRIPTKPKPSNACRSVIYSGSL